jgi:AraC-like DNA-binding protein
VKALPFTIPKHDNAAVMIQIDRQERFYDKFHQHEEIQISMIVEGEGELVAGDRVIRYQPNDIFVLGSYMPHLFKTDTSIEGESHMLSLFFTPSWFEQFLQTEEVKELSPLLSEINFGIHVLSLRDEIEVHFLECMTASPINRLIHFLSILSIIRAAERTPLSIVGRRKSMRENEGLRMQRIMNHTLNYFEEHISLEAISEVANLSPTAFCRYFKQRTNKTFFQFLNEIRIEHACKLLRKETEFSISEISERSGFLNLSNFNRSFKKEKGITPSQFRKQKLA